MSRFLVAAAIVATGCGRIGFGAEAALGDGATDDAAVDSTDDPVMAATCNTVARLVDDFADGNADPRWDASFENPGTSYAETGGQLAIAPSTNMTGTAGLKSFRYYDLRSSRAFVRVDQVTAAADTTTALGIELEQGMQVSVAYREGELHARSNLTSLAAIPYSRDDHRYWAIRELDGRLYFEHSSDGITFTAFHDIAAPFDVSLVRYMLFAGATAAIPAPGVALFDDVNGNGTKLRACATSSFVDRFDGDLADRAWRNSYSNACCTQSYSDGELAIGTDGTQGYSARRSAAGFSLRDSQLRVRIAKRPAGPDFAAIVGVKLGDTDLAEILVTSTSLIGRTVIRGTPSSSSVPFADASFYVQLRESGGTLYFEYATDPAGPYSMIRQVPTPAAVDDGYIILSGGSDTAGVVPDSIRLDDLNVP